MQPMLMRDQLPHTTVRLLSYSFAQQSILPAPSTTDLLKLKQIMTQDPDRPMILKRIIAADSLLINDFNPWFDQEITAEDIISVIEGHLNNDQNNGYWFSTLFPRCPLVAIVHRSY